MKIIRNKKDLFSAGIAVFLFIIAFWWITYTADWQFYEVAYYQGTHSKEDWGFIYLINIMRSHGFDYQSFYKMEVLIMALLYPFLFYKLRISPILSSIVLIALMYVQLANQVRYYMAFPLTVVSFYFLLSKREKIYSLVTGLCAVLIHSGLIAFVLVVLLFAFLVKKYESHLFKWIIVVNLVLGLLFSFFSSFILPELGMYSYYFTAENQIATFAGGLYRTFPFLFGLILIYRMHSKLKSVLPNLMVDNMYFFLLVISTASSLLLFISLRTHIIIHRMMDPLIVCWIAYFVHIYKTFPKKKLKEQAVLSLSIILCVRFLWLTYVPFYLGINHSLLGEELLLILQSIKM